MSCWLYFGESPSSLAMVRWWILNWIETAKLSVRVWIESAQKPSAAQKHDTIEPHSRTRKPFKVDWVQQARADATLRWSGVVCILLFVVYFDKKYQLFNSVRDWDASEHMRANEDGAASKSLWSAVVLSLRHCWPQPSDFVGIGFALPSTGW